MNHVVIAHYDFPLDWINKITTDKAVAIIYSASKPHEFEPLSIPKHFARNKGMDASMYLSYIIDHYNELPERTLFVHHHEENWTQDYPLPFIINNLNWNAAKYFSIGNRKMYVNPYSSISNEHQQIIKDNWYIFQGNIEHTENIFFYCGTQFCVHRDLILQYPVTFYKGLLNWVYETPLADYYTGRMFEYYWHYLLTHDPVDNDIKYLL